MQTIESLHQTKVSPAAAAAAANAHKNIHGIDVFICDLTFQHRVEYFKMVHQRFTNGQIDDSIDFPPSHTTYISSVPLQARATSRLVELY